MKYTFLYTVLLFSSCINSEGKKQTNDKADKSESNSYRTIDSKQLQGIWAENKEGNAAFSIIGDSIIYVESPDFPSTYHIKEDTLTIIYKDGSIHKNNIMKLDGDSLVYRTETNDVIKLSRRK